MTQRPGQGAVLYLGALLMFSSMDACTKFLVGSLPVAQVMWARFAFSLLAVLAVMRASGRPIRWRSRAPRLQVLRSLCLCACNALFALALVYVPLAEATAVNYASPLITVVLAATLLREAVSRLRWIGVGLGLLGVLLVLRPGLQGAHPTALIALASAVGFAAYQVLTRQLAGVDPPAVTILHTSIWATLAATFAGPLVWTWPTAAGWGLFVLLGGLGAGGHYLLVLAYARAPASLLAPIGYTGLVWSALFGLILYGEVPTAYTLAGAAIIALGGLVAIVAETRARPHRAEH